MAYNVEYITSGLEKAYESFYDKIELVNDIVSTPPDGTAFWGTISTVSHGVTAAAISLACLYALVGYIKNGIDFRGNWEGMLKCFLRLILTKGLITNSTGIMLSLYDIAADACNGISSGIEMEKTVKIADNPDGLIATMLCYMKYLPIEIILWLCGILIMVISIGVIAQVAIYIMFAPISLAQFASSGFDGIRNFLKDYFAACLQGAVVMASMSMFSVIISNKSVFGQITDNYYGDIGLSFIYCFVLIKLLMSSQAQARKLMS